MTARCSGVCQSANFGLVRNIVSPDGWGCRRAGASPRRGCARLLRIAPQIAGGGAPTGALGSRPPGLRARHTLARRVESLAQRPSPLGAPPRRFRERAGEAASLTSGRACRPERTAPVVQQAPCTRVIVSVGRGPEASREPGRLSQTRGRRPCFCQQAPPVGAPQQAGYGNIIPRNMVLSSGFGRRRHRFPGNVRSPGVRRTNICSRRGFPLLTRATSASISCCSSEAGFGPYQSARLSRYDASSRT